MKITLSNKFFTQLLQLPAQSQTYVLSVCKHLTESDEDTMLGYQLPTDAPDLLVELVDNLKKRINNARRRRERRAANPKPTPITTPDKQPVASPTAADKGVSAAAAIDLYEMAVDVIVTAGNLLSRSDRARVRQLAKALMKHIDCIAALPANQAILSRRRA